MLERPPPRLRRLISVFAALLLLAGVSSPAWGEPDLNLHGWSGYSMHDTYQTTSTMAYGKDWSGVDEFGYPFNPGIPDSVVKFTCRRSEAELGNCYCEAVLLNYDGSQREATRCEISFSSSGTNELEIGKNSPGAKIKCVATISELQGKAGNSKIYNPNNIYCPVLAGQLNLSPQKVFPLIFGKPNTSRVSINVEVLYSGVSVNSATAAKGGFTTYKSGHLEKGAHPGSYLFLPILEN